MAKAKWNKTEKRWKLRVQINKKMHVFTSRRSGSIGKKECEEKYREFCEKNIYEANYLRVDMTIDEVWKRYLSHCKSKYGEGSYPYLDAERIGRLYVLPVLSQKKMKHIRLEDYQSIINEAKPVRGINGNTVLSKKYLTSMRYNINSFIKWAYQNDYCEGFKGDLYIPNNRPFYGKEVLQPEDIKRLLEPSDLWYHPLFCFLLLTGMRPGEALGLQIDDYAENRVIITRSVNYKGIITNGKNKNARRIVPLCDQAIKILDDTIARNRNEGLDTDWIFCSISGGPGNQGTADKQWNKLKVERNLPGTPYSLRGTWISMFKNSMTTQQLKAVVGHSASMPTFEIYSKALDGELEAQREIINDVIGNFIV